MKNYSTQYNKLQKIPNILLNKIGLELSYLKTKRKSMDEEFLEIYDICKEYTFTSIHKMYATYLATKYCGVNGIEGDFVECGVWKGGSSMLIALTLNKINKKDKKIYLYDTFEGMTKPDNSVDIRKELKNAEEKWNKYKKKNYNKWCYISIEEVKKNMFKTKYPKNKIVFVKGDVKKTFNEVVPEKISLLRLDTDFYESTKKELEILFPRLSIGGILLIDDYDVWKGARKAVDEYFNKNKITPLLSLTGNSGRLMMKI